MAGQYRIWQDLSEDRNRMTIRGQEICVVVIVMVLI